VPEHQKKTDWLIAGVTLAIVLMPPIAYVGGYFALGEICYRLTERETPQGLELVNEGQVRVFPSRWQANLYVPAAKVESLICTENITTEADE
jgi:hypothetical protein